MAFTRRAIFTILFILCFISTFMFLGCSKINKENYGKLKVGMGYEEVLKIIGKPDSCKSTLGVKNCVWEESSKKIRVKFVVDKVLWLSSDRL